MTEVLSTISVRMRIRTGRIWLLSRTVYMTKLMNHDGSRRPPGVETPGYTCDVPKGLEV